MAMAHTDENPPVSTGQPGSTSQDVDAALKRINGWIDRHLAADGSWGREADTSAYFAPILFCNQIGRHEEARRMLCHVEKALGDPSEVLRQGSYRDGMVAYVPSWILVGAFDAECYSLANRLAAFIIRFQAKSGGFFGTRQARDAGVGPIDFDTTAMSVIGLGRAGRVDAATKGAEFLVRLLEAQPLSDLGLLTEWDEVSGLVAADRLANPVSHVDHAKAKQKYYKTGLIVNALLQAYGASGERRFLEAATNLYDDTVARATSLWNNTAAHKMCWASTTLHNITAQPRFAEHSWRYASHLVTNQHEDGTFHYPEIWPSFPPTRWEMIPNMMCQFGIWLARTAEIPPKS